jgi:predicted nucleic acid-binding protein
MAYLIDTNVVSELRKGARCDAHVAAWFETVTPEELYLSVLSVGEIRRGIELARRKDHAKAAALDRWLDGLELYYADRLITITTAIAERWGRICPDQPLSVTDGLLAATCQEHRLVMVTRNTTDFVRSGIRTLNPFMPAAER